MAFLSHSSGLMEMEIDLWISCMKWLKFLYECEVSDDVKLSHYQAAEGGSVDKELFSDDMALLIFMDRMFCALLRSQV